MAYLDRFSEDERQFLAALIYRAGLWVSVADATGGHEADSGELAALEKAIDGIVRQPMFESAFVHEVMSLCATRHAEWPSWSVNPQAVPDECRRAVDLLQGKDLQARDIDAYRRILMQIGLEVARAFREYDRHAPLSHRIVRAISIMVDRFFGAMHGEKHVSADILNISYSEDIALNKLAMALRGDVDHAAQARILTQS